ncbi:hypothetical protein [Telluribacter sp. SYSU D00476]|uniref:hypothetical protein n=1 Tax=Telluribacter sp. SYSU D00476 TaxID=2811430 RepID=UPI001FF6B179|nr:hypothetical protein [Telluribacter sp. SYSU D00476]
MTDRQYTIVSTWGALVGVPSTLLSYFKDAPVYLQILAGTLCMISLTYLLYKVTSGKTGKSPTSLPPTPEPINLPARSSQDVKNWELEKLVIILDILDNKGDQVKCIQKIDLICKEACKLFKILVSPADKINDIEVSDGHDHRVQRRPDNGLEVFIDFPTEIPSNKQLSLQVSYTFVESFTEDFEFWKFKKYYNGKNLTVIILYPNDRPPKGYQPLLYDDLMNPKNLMHKSSYTFINKRPTIKLETDDLFRDQEVLISWSW